MYELKPCPFCGSKPIMEHKILKPFYDFWYVKCDTCSVEISNPSMTEKEAIEVWNRRQQLQ